MMKKGQDEKSCLFFYTTNPQIGWNGIWKGKPQSNGVYVAIASGLDYRGLVIDRQASFMIIR